MPSLIGNRIRELRKQAHLTQTELAKDIVTPSMISQIEAGKASPSRALLSKLALRLHTPPEYLLEQPMTQETIASRIEVIRACILMKRFDDAKYWIDQTLEPSAMHVELYVLLAKTLMGMRRFQEASHALAQSMTECFAQNRNDLLPEILLMQGDLYRECSDLYLAIDGYEQAYKALPYQVKEHARNAVEICLRLSRVYHDVGDTANARYYEQKALDHVIFEENGEKMCEDRLAQALALLRTSQSAKEQEAMQLAICTYSMIEARTYLESALRAYLLQAEQDIAEKRYAEAKTWLIRAKTCALLHETPSLRARRLLLSAITAYAEQQPDVAFEYAKDALSIAHLEDEDETLYILLMTSVAAHKAGQLTEALTLANCAKAGVEDCPNLHLRQQTLSWLSQLYALTGNIKAAKRILA